MLVFSSDNNLLHVGFHIQTCTSLLVATFNHLHHCWLKNQLGSDLDFTFTFRNRSNIDKKIFVIDFASNIHVFTSNMMLSDNLSARVGHLFA